MVSEFARKLQKNHHSRSNLRNCALHKMSRTSKNQEKAAVCKDKTGGEALNSATFSHTPYAVAKEQAEGPRASKSGAALKGGPGGWRRGARARRRGAHTGRAERRPQGGGKG